MASAVCWPRPWCFAYSPPISPGKLSEFFDKVRGEVGLREARGFVESGSVYSRADAGGERAGNSAYALGLGGIRAQVLLEGDFFEQNESLGEWCALVELPEEAGIVEAGAEHALVAVADEGLTGGVSLRVEHSEEVRRKPAAFVFHGEVALVIAHDRDQYLFGES